MALVAPERLRYQRDGVDLDCWVMKPAAYEPGRRYPALLNVHGGPHTPVRQRLLRRVPGAGRRRLRGLYTNPRGSQGYGEEFTRAVIGDWGGGDYAD